MSVLLICAGAEARKKPEVWLEVRSPHFLVATNGSEKQARRVAGQFERIRAVFHSVFPGQRVDPAAPIIVLATKDHESFDHLLPPAMLVKGAARRSGLFLRGPDKNYVLLELDAVGDNPYHALYHEYTHLLLHQNPIALPPWLDEGLAEYYGNSRIEKNRVELGRPDPQHVALLRHTRLLPLSTLFTVTHRSPYYNENRKATIFYAESWALVHMLMSEDFKQKSHRLRDYLDDLQANMNSVSAARQAFGNLKELENRLERYVNHMAFRVFVAKTQTEVDDRTFTVRKLTRAQADALCGDFMVYEGDFQRAHETLARALAEDPRNGPAATSMGFLEFQQRHTVAAQKWFTKAIQLDSQSYLALYYYAMMRLREAPTERMGDDVGESLRKAIELNPRFAPAYNALAQFYMSRDEKLDEAHRMALRAVSLDPGEVFYYLTVASVLLHMRQADNAVRVSEKALAMAKKPEELAAAQTMLENAQRFQAELQSLKRTRQHVAMNAAQNGGFPASPVLRRRNRTPVTPPEETSPESLSFQSDPKQRGARDMLIGTIRDVKCSEPAVMKLTLQTKHQTVLLFSANFYSVAYFALNFTPHGEIHPCRDLEGRKAKVFFYDLKGKPNQGELISVRLRK